MICLFFQVWWCDFVGDFRVLGHADRQYSLLNGRLVRVLAHTPFALGGVPVKILQGRWLHFHPILI